VDFNNAGNARNVYYTESEMNETRSNLPLVSNKWVTNLLFSFHRSFWNGVWS